VGVRASSLGIDVRWTGHIVVGYVWAVKKPQVPATETIPGRVVKRVGTNIDPERFFISPVFSNVPGRARTFNLRLRRPTLYPIELQELRPPILVAREPSLNRAAWTSGT
jgi:hypothetical protein